MRIAVSADDPRGLDSAVCHHFGRCPYYVLVDVEGCEINDTKVVDNPFYGQHQPGQVPGFIREQGANVMLAGGMGGRAVAFFEQYGIQPATGAAATVRQSVERYLGGGLQGAVPCHESVEHGHRGVAAPGAFEQDEVGRLREEAESIQRQTDEVMARLRRLQGH